VLRRLHPNEYAKIEDLMLRELGPASLEWLYYFETEKDRIIVYSSESLEDCMTILEGVNIVIVTDSQATLQDFLRKLDAQKSCAFRCPEWMAPTIMGRFPPKSADYRGVVLLTYSVNEKDFRSYVDDRYTVRILSEGDAEEVTVVYSKSHWSPEFIRERIRKGAFYGIYEANKLVSWLGTIWESKKAYEIGFAFTKEECRRKGLMKTLTSILTEKALSKGKIPLLHTVKENLPAIRVAQSLGYSLKAKEWAYFYNP